MTEPARVIDGHVMTVAGPIPPDSLGITLPHEHLYCAPNLDAQRGAETGRPLTWATAAECRWNPLDFPENFVFTDVDLTISELRPFTETGGRSIVDVTPTVLGRNPEALLEISRRAGINVVMGGGYYTTAFHPEDVSGSSVEALADRFIQEATSGVGDSGVRIGIMGEIGTADPLDSAEAKLLRAHAQAHHVTGLGLSIHLQAFAKEGPAVLAILEAERVPPDRVYLGHMNASVDDPDYQQALLDRGVLLGFDFFGMDHSEFAYGKIPPDPPGHYLPTDYEACKAIVRFVRMGFVNQILVSHDIGERIRLQVYAGWGFGHVTGHIVPLLLALGLEPSEVHTLLVDNPRRLLTIPRPAGTTV